MNALLLLACATTAMRVPEPLADVEPVALGARALDLSFDVGASRVREVRLGLRVDGETDDPSAAERGKERFTFTVEGAGGALHAACIQRYVVAEQELRLDCTSDGSWSPSVVKEFPTFSGELVAADGSRAAVSAIGALENGWEPNREIGYQIGDLAAMELLNRGRIWTAATLTPEARVGTEAAFAALFLWREIRRTHA